MSATIEQRLETVEMEHAQLKARVLTPPVKKDPWSTVGWAKDCEHYDAALKAGEDYRKHQTYEKEIEARGGAGY
ncbi:MAG: hypothetical protein JWO89_1142 [Verrucomicrobiaceae bacterium]|nr:hypothetical protein [Verrucomicrobiaceae bacterium]